MKRRSLFGPFVLIAIGVIWLLVATNIVPPANLWALVQFAPYALMGFGLALLVRSRWDLAGQLITGLVIIMAIAAVFFAPKLGWNKTNFLSWSLDLGGGTAGSGIIKSEDRKPGDFTSIALRYPAEVVIKQAGSTSVKIEADDNLLPQITTVVRAGTLEIDNNLQDWDAKRVKPTKPVKITITVKDLNAIDFSSAGSVQVESLDTDSLRVTLSGAGEVHLHNLKVSSLNGTLSGAGSMQADGTADELDMRISGFGNFDGAELQSLTASVHISGAGDSTVRVKNELSATITGAGSVRYYGSPNIQKQISGAGSIQPAQ